MNRPIIVTAFCFLFVVTSVQISLANEGDADKYQLGFHAGISLAAGEPFNDSILVGLSGKYHLKDKWLVTMGVDYLQFDFENPAYHIGLPADKVKDGSFTEYIISVGAQREFSKIWKMTPFVSGGLGIGIISEEDVSGTHSGGTPYTIKSDVGTEFIPNLGGGFRLPTSENTSFEFGLRVDYHITDWTITDSLSPATGTMDDFLAYGINFGFVYDF